MNKDKMTMEEEIDKSLLRLSDKGEISCAASFDIVEKLNVSPATVGECADRLNIKIVKCQLGLFGYHPEKKIAKASSDVESKLKGKIEAALVGNRLPCASAWEIAKSLKIGKMKISSACEAMGIKIKPCQLGAFKH